MQSYASRSLRIYLLDDHDIVRRGLRDLLAVKRDITVVGDSGSATGAADRILALRPDVMILDLQLQDGSGVQVCRDVRSIDPSIRALFLTAAADDEALASAVLAGAAGYATKLVHTLEILDDVRRIGAGRSLIDPATMQRVRERVERRMTAGGNADEREILGYVLDGRTDAEIAELIHLPHQAAASRVAAVVAAALGSLTR